MKKFFLIFPLFVSLSYHASELLPQAFVDMYNLSHHIVGPLDLKKQGNSFIKGFFYGLTNKFQQKYFNFSQDDDQKLVLANLFIMVPNTLSFIDCYHNRNSLCLITRILGFSAGQIIGRDHLFKKS